MAKKLTCLILLILLSALTWAKNTIVDINVSTLPQEKLKLTMHFTKRLTREPASFVTKTPARIVLDFLNTDSKVAKNLISQQIEEGNLTGYKLLSVQGRVRVVIDLVKVTSFTSNMSGKTFSIILAGESKQTTEAKEQVFVSNKPVRTRHHIQGINFKGVKDNGGKLIVTVSDSEIPINVRQTGKIVEVTFYNTSLPKKLYRRYDVTDFHSPARYVNAEQRGKNVIIRLTTKGDFGQFAYQVDDRFVVDVFPLTAAEIEQAKLQKKVFSGKRISLNFQNISVRAVLQLLADFTGTNMVVSDSVTGNITLRLNNIPWDEALNIILTTRGLGQRKLDNVILIAPAQEIAKREQSEMQAIEQAKQLAPLQSDLLQINYAKASDIAALLKDDNNTLLSKRGTLSVDERTNTIWIQDTGVQIEEIQELIKKLDVPVKQVLIESRIVIVSKDFEQDIGVRFGVTRPTHLSGTLNGANQMEQGTLPADVTPFTDRLNVDLIAAPTTGNAATLGIALAKLGEGILLDLELSALESEGRGEVISSPRLITADQQEANIEAGEEIPYQEATSSGATSISFKKAVLSLRVTPQITPDDRLILKIKVNQDSRGESTGVVGAPPAIDTKSIDTNVLVNNGQTIVLGGIYKQEKKHQIFRVPFLGKLPVLGVLFRQKQNIVKNEELLIFITPKIIRNSMNITDVAGGKLELDKFGKPVMVQPRG